MPNSCITPVIPAQVQVYFPFGGYLATVSLDDVGLNIPSFPGTKTFKDTADSSKYSPSDDESESGDGCIGLDDLAEQMATDYWQYSAQVYDYVWSQILLWQPEGISDCVIFTFDANEISTRTLTPPLNIYPEEFLHFWMPCGSGTPESESSYCPNWSGTLQRVTDVQCSSGNIKVYKQTITIDCGQITATSAITNSTEGCCDCGS